MQCVVPVADLLWRIGRQQQRWAGEFLPVAFGSLCSVTFLLTFVLHLSAIDVQFADRDMTLPGNSATYEPNLNCSWRVYAPATLYAVVRSICLHLLVSFAQPPLLCEQATHYRGMSFRFTRFGLSGSDSVSIYVRHAHSNRCILSQFRTAACPIIFPERSGSERFEPRGSGRGASVHFHGSEPALAQRGLHRWYSPACPFSVARRCFWVA